MFLLAAVYFIAVAGLGQASVYSVVGAVLCFIAAGLLVVKKDNVITGFWRAATAVFCLVMFVAQVFANALSPAFTGVYLVGSTLINGAFLILFIGVLLSTTQKIVKKSEEVIEEEEKKKPKKLTYEV